ncbi:uncharacterized protein CCR75_002945 [Bremia lactucae]|uniref:Mitochondrial inner membrane protease subunit n=1 Tax=Bremia lactucae TaxID=4779 RepID=A0A976NZS4_BRELC|nr:hypothetical protein CCR75_002945 [Bremia lactucae]
MGTARNGVLIMSWAIMIKEYLCDIKYGMGESMSPTIPDGSFVFSENMSRRWRNWKRGDIVQLLSPTRYTGETITKRIIAVVGTLLIIETRLIICSQLSLQEGDIVELQPRFNMERRGKITIPKGHVWVEGDNPTCSVDSRQFGAVPAALLTGKPFLIAREWKWVLL